MGDVTEAELALGRIRAALAGVEATEAGGFTGDPYVDAIHALRARLAEARRAAYARGVADMRREVHRGLVTAWDEQCARLGFELRHAAHALDAAAERLRAEVDRE